MAAEYLKSIKYKIVQRNFRTPLGEIDIIAIDKDSLVFVEVKYGKEAYLRVNKKKMENISHAADAFLKYFGDFGRSKYRIDVISISEDGKVNHFKDVSMDFA
ncbi:endonuclease [Athalassotoga saccharophila]|nr:endonuclease [Athalassotoga saccharophila]